MKTFWKHTVVVLLMLGAVVKSAAEIRIESGDSYRLVCTAVGQCGMAIGKQHNLRAPLVHMQNGDWPDLYWTLERKGDDRYSIRNNETGQYVTLDTLKTVYNDYVALTDTMQGDSSVWIFKEYASNFLIVNAADTLQQLYVIQGRYFVGAHKVERPATDRYARFVLYDLTGHALLPEAERSKDVRNYLDTLLFDGVRPVMDKRSGALMVSVAAEKANLNLAKVTLKYSDPWGRYTLYVNNRRTANGSSVNFGGGALSGKALTLTLRSRDGLVAQTPLYVTYMPIVEITGSGFSRTAFSEGTLSITDADYPENNDSTYNAMVRWRGGSTTYKQKKAYAVKLTDKAGGKIDRRMHGLRSDNYWVLDPMAIDKARMRNPLSFEVWHKMATPFYFSEQEPKAQKASRCFFVEVLLNGSYVGIYNMMERQDRKQFKLKKPKIEDGVETVRGVLYKGSQWSDCTRMVNGYKPSAYDNTKEEWLGWEIKLPDLDDMSHVEWGPLNAAVNFVCGTTGTNFSRQAAEYFDLPVFRDYFLFLDLIHGYDNMGKNLYLLAHDVGEDKRLSVAPWDMDGTWGRQWDGSIGPSQAATYNIDGSLRSTFGLYVKLVNYYPRWHETMAERYRELRRSVLKEDTLRNIIARNFDLFKRSGADVRETDRWNGADGIALDFATEREYLLEWTSKRLASLDRKYGYDPSGVETLTDREYVGIAPAQGGVDVESYVPRSIAICDLSGRMLRRVEVPSGVTFVPLTCGVYIIERQKVAVR